MKKSAVAVILALMVAGGATIASGSDSDSDSTNSTNSTNSSNTDKDGNYQFGKSFTWDGGMEAELGQPKSYTPSDPSDTIDDHDFKGGTGVTLEIKVTNNTGKKMNLATNDIDGSAGGKECAASVEGDMGLESADVDPGQSISYKAGMLCDGKPGDAFSVDYTPDELNYDAVTWAGVLPGK